MNINNHECPSSKKKEENQYMNSIVDFINIINMPPPYDSIYKSFYGLP